MLELEHVAIAPEYLAEYRPAPYSPEVALWRSVILLALQDAYGPAGINRTYARRFLAGRGLILSLELADIPTERAPILRDWVPPSDHHITRKSYPP